MSQKYSHLFFDLDHTLWDTDRNAEESLSEIFEELNLTQKGVPDFDTFHVQYKQHNERLWGLYSDNKVGKDAVRLHRFVHTLQDFDIHDDAIMMRCFREMVNQDRTVVATVNQVCLLLFFIH